MSRRFLLILSVLTVFSALLISSCEFETKKVWDRPVDPDPGPPVVTPVYLDLEEDTVWLLYEREVSFRFISSMQDIRGVEFLIDGTVSNSYLSDEGVYILDHASLQEGIHSLQINLVTSSGTGSLADITGAEGYLFTRSWVLYVIKDYNVRLDAAVNEGCLSFSWKDYPASDFVEFIIYRELGYNNRVEAGRSKTAGFTDCSYVGEGAQYYIEMTRKDADPVPWGNVSLERELPALRFSANRQNEYTVSWSRSRYYGAVASFIISMSSIPGWEYVIVKVTDDPDDNSLALPSSVLFADRMNYKLLVVPENRKFYNLLDRSRFETDLYDTETGFRFRPDGFNAFQPEQTGPDEFLYISGCDSLVRYSVTLEKVTEKLGYTPMGCSMCNFGSYEISPSGRTISSRFDCDFDLMVTGSGNLKDYSRYDLQSLSGPWSNTKVPISDAGTGLVSTANNGFYIYDFNSSSPAGYYGNENSGTAGLSISSDGRYLFVDDAGLRLVRFDDPGFTTIWSKPDYGLPDYFEFHGTDPDGLVMWDGTRFAKINCSDFSEEYGFLLTDDAILHIDYCNGRMLSFTEGHLFVRNLSDGSLIEDIHINIDPTNWFYRCILVNNAVICITGVIYFIN